MATDFSTASFGFFSLRNHAMSGSTVPRTDGRDEQRRERREQHARRRGKDPPRGVRKVDVEENRGAEGEKRDEQRRRGAADLSRRHDRRGDEPRQPPQLVARGL